MRSLMPPCSEMAKSLVREYLPKIRAAAHGTHQKLNVTYLLMEFASKLETCLKTPSPKKK